VIGDQGSPEGAAIDVKAGGTAWTEESGRGLWLIDELADDWGTACHSAGRVVWADIRWLARGGPRLEAPGGLEAAIADIAATRRAFPGATIWWGHLTQAWWAAHPGASGLMARRPQADCGRCWRTPIRSSARQRRLPGLTARRSRPRWSAWLGLRRRLLLSRPRRKSLVNLAPIRLGNAQGRAMS
jgi:hypothetical protein